MSSVDFKALVEQLAAEFKRRGMKKHLQLLRGYYRREFKQRAEGEWSTEMVLDWLAMMRLGQFADFYKTAPREKGCPFCGAADAGGAPGFFTEVAWEGGTRLRCNNCHRSWLRLEAPPT